MNLIINHDPYLKKETKIVQSIIKKVFGYSSIITQKQRYDFLEFKEELGIYKVRFPKEITNTVYVTGNQIAAAYATSAHDFLLGQADYKNRNCVISTARLHGKKLDYSVGIFESDNENQVSEKEYKMRIELLTIHEIGHWAVKDQTHFEEVDPFFDAGPHCEDKKCIMYPTSLNKTKLYDTYFCKMCCKSMIESYSPKSDNT